MPAPSNQLNTPFLRFATSDEDYRESLKRFAARVPELLNRNTVTVSQGIEFGRLNLGAQLDRRQFRVAVVGRMKAGKSTLLNALVDQPLAPVDVDPMTATVNWFEYSSEGERECFEIHWKDRARGIELRPLDAITSLSGARAEAAEIDFIRFYSGADFLRGVTLIDTPGTMSLDDSHEAATTDFLTRRFGDGADATVLVLPTVVTQADLNTLLDHAAQSRLPGQGAYNTIAVLQRWETLNSAAPENEAHRLAADFRQRLDGHVSEVLPVSGLLAIMSRNTPTEIFDKLSFLANRAAGPDLKALLGSEARFCQERDGLPLSGLERRALFAETEKALFAGLRGRTAGTFEMLKFTLGYAHRLRLDSGERLKAAVGEVSNVDTLKEIVNRRFFAIAGLIRAGSVLTKALEPCRVAKFTLREKLDRHIDLANHGERLESALNEQVLNLAARRRIHSYVARSLALIRGEIDPIASTLRELDRLLHEVEGDFALLMADINCLNELSVGGTRLPSERVGQARRLFGQYGMMCAERLGLELSASMSVQLAAATELRSVFAKLAAGLAGDQIAAHAVDRLDRILNELEMLA